MKNTTNYTRKTGEIKEGKKIMTNNKTIKTLQLDDITNYFEVRDVCNKFIQNNKECYEENKILLSAAYEEWKNKLKNKEDQEAMRETKEKIRKYENISNNIQQDSERWKEEIKVIYNVLERYIRVYVNNSINENIEVLKDIPLHYKKFKKLMNDILKPLKFYGLEISVSTYKNSIYLYVPYNENNDYGKYFGFQYSTEVILSYSNGKLRVNENGAYDHGYSNAAQHVKDIASIKDIEESVINALKAKKEIEKVKKQYQLKLKEIYNTFIPECDYMLEKCGTVESYEACRWEVEQL